MRMHIYVYTTSTCMYLYDLYICKYIYGYMIAGRPLYGGGSGAHVHMMNLTGTRWGLTLAGSKGCCLRMMMATYSASNICIRVGGMSRKA